MTRSTAAAETAPRKVIPFERGPRSYASTPHAGVVWEVLNHPEFAARLKEEVESAVLGALLIENAKSVTNVDDPFGSIYISALQPDSIEQADIAKLTRFANIVDLSDQLEITDGWDE
jgi:hypothetical protein